MHLSNRLLAIAEMVSPSSKVADIGTDHAYIPIYLCQTGKIVSAIAMDIHQGPLQRAKENIRQHKLENKIETRLSDGLQRLEENEADCLVIAGMGGALTVRILSQKEKLTKEAGEIILQPQSEIGKVRQYLAEQGFSIREERMVKEEGKYYPMMKACYRGVRQSLAKAQMEYGPMLLENKDELLKEYLKLQKKSLEKISENLQRQKTKASLKRAEEIKRMEILVSEGLSYYEQR